MSSMTRHHLPHVKAIDQVARVVETVVKNRRCLILSGAGISTSSGVPAYRGSSGLYTRGHRPITWSDFVKRPNQVRYFARSFLGFSKVRNAKINSNHVALAHLVQNSSKFFNFHVTQNVDGLSIAALHKEIANSHKPLPERFGKGDSRHVGHLVSELHGTLHQVKCLSCGELEDRIDFQNRLRASNQEWLDRLQKENPNINISALVVGEEEQARQQQDQKQKEEEAEAVEKKFRADGDFFLTDSQIYGEKDEKGKVGFNLIGCRSCAVGAVMPNLVFFGGSIPSHVKEKAYGVCESAECNSLLVAGSSLATPSAYRFVREMTKKKCPIVIFNDGETRIDEELAKQEELMKKDPSLLSSTSSSLTLDPKLILKVEGQLEHTLPLLALSMPRD